MPKNKTVRRGKSRQAKYQPPTNVLITMKKTEKDFLQSPAKLATLFNKEIVTLKQKEQQLHRALAKLTQQMKKAEMRVKAAKTKNTPAAKKQSNTSKKTHNEIVKAHTMLSKQLQTTKALGTVAKNKQAKMLALSKFLNEFEKKWVKDAKKTHITKIKAKSKIKKPVKPIISILPVDEKPHLEVIQTETIIDDTKSDEMTQAVA